ncbi:unnamed protein product [Staurois parvus]|uniref:Uncharacterized protein n=1 Tax=Staurois parvus TaxID=386267 RepID=A0ABN9BPR5_9NEOB|nr:unnamed protein product [Staurois parvus]
MFSVCVGWAACCHSVYLPPLPGEFQPGICQSVDPSSSTYCNCHLPLPATNTVRL